MLLFVVTDRLRFQFYPWGENLLFKSFLVPVLKSTGKNQLGKAIWMISAPPLC